MSNQINIQPPVRAVIFDLGGVILRTDNQEPRRLLAERYGLSYSELDAIVFNNPVAQKAESGQASVEQVWMEIGRILQIPPAQVPTFRREFFKGDQVDQELVSIIDKIHANYRTVLLSNTWIQDLEKFVIDDLKIPAVFDAYVSSARSGTAKPESKIFEIALQAAGALPQEAVFIDDNFANIEGASRIGIRTIRFFNTTQVVQDLQTFIDIGPYPKS